MNQLLGRSHRRLLLAGLIGLVVLIAPLLWIGLASRPAHAQSGASSAQTPTPNPEPVVCPALPTAGHCDGFEPDFSGCTQDERTVKAVPVLHRNRLIGSAQLQYSASCDCYWLVGRALANTAEITSMEILGDLTSTKSGTINLPSLLPDGERVVLGFLHYHTPPTGTDAQVAFDFPVTDPPVRQVVSV